VVGPKVAGRPGGYTRIIKLGIRLGDNAERAMIELVDFNEIYGKGIAEAAAPAKKTRRSSAGKKKQQLLKKLLQRLQKKQQLSNFQNVDNLSLKGRTFIPAFLFCTQIPFHVTSRNEKCTGGTCVGRRYGISWPFIW